eukprot:CAMPEP_0185265802 /NCGR_PEP_ID=MMETSP1359-20130426/28859_1 /TAXON_ID=552665 /ORGANISM="Bigelowiella longifila, Strain CCMP242" /LENGTH=63 /DNA_ID=CAMNT_0027855285 /DNA_START=64 /DNA_END=256 /DNA_ORIENTATION=+
MRVLPANERSQFRWNSNPFALDGGNGRADYDPAAWLLPYGWAAISPFLTTAANMMRDDVHEET